MRISVKESAESLDETEAPALPTRSEKAMVKPTTPSESLDSTGRVACHVVRLPPLVSRTVAGLPASVPVGSTMASLEEKERVRLSPDLARAKLLFALLERRARLLSSY